MTHPKADGNQTQIVEDLRKLGYKVLILTRVKDGCPDLLVADPRIRRQWLVELKVKGGKLTPDEEDFLAQWPDGLWCIARTTEDILAFINTGGMTL